MNTKYWFGIGVVCAFAACKPTEAERNNDAGNGGEPDSGKGGKGGMAAKGGAGGKGGSAGKGGTSGDAGGSGDEAGAFDGGKGGSAGKGGSGANGGSPGTAGDTGEAGSPSASGKGGTLGSAGDASYAGETSAGGAGGDDGSKTVDEGPPGSVGNKCKSLVDCDADLECAKSHYCQPSVTSQPVEIVQVVPPPDSANVPASAPLLLFADGTYADVSFNVKAYTTAGVTDLTASISFVTLASNSGNDIYVLAAKGGFPLGASIVVSISGPFTGTIVFNVAHASPPYADDALAFDGAADPAGTCTSSLDGITPPPVGWTGFGDFGVIPQTGTIVPTSGDRVMAMSTGALLCDSAIGDTSSMVVSGPIRGFGPEPSFKFDYNFQSSEFDDYCNSEYDDTLIAVLAGPNGIIAKVVDSVNLACARTASRATGVFPGQPDDGDGFYGETGNLPFTLQGGVGEPAVLAFVVTDVSDAALSTLVSIDSIVAP